MAVRNRSWQRCALLGLVLWGALHGQCVDTGSHGVDGLDQTALEMGTPVRLRVSESVPASARAGDHVKLKVLEEVRLKGRLTVILRGAEASATVAPGTRRRVVPWRRAGWT